MAGVSSGQEGIEGARVEALRARARDEALRARARDEALRARARGVTRCAFYRASPGVFPRPGVGRYRAGLDPVERGEPLPRTVEPARDARAWPSAALARARPGEDAASRHPCGAGRASRRPLPGRPGGQPRGSWRLRL